MNFINGKFDLQFDDVDIERGSLRGLSFSPPTKKHIARDDLIDHRMRKIYHNNRTLFIIKALSLVGMTLLAIASFLNDSSNTSYAISLYFGMILTGVVASFYCLDTSINFCDTCFENTL